MPIKTKIRTWLINGREALGLDRQAFGVKCDCSDRLIWMLEETGTITHPQIAAAIIRLIGGSVDQYNDLVDKSHHARVVPKVKQPKGRGKWYSKMI